MKSFSTLYESALNEMTNIPIGELMQLYDRFNVEYFDNILPRSHEITIKYGSIKGAAGVAKASLRNGVVPISSIQLIIDSKTYFPDDDLKGILVHEMIHIYFFVTGNPRENHGYKFLSKLRDLNKKTSFLIPLKDDIEREYTDDAKDKLLGVAIRSYGNKTYTSLFNPKIIDQVKDKYKSYSDVKLFTANTKIHHKYPVAIKPTSLKFYTLTPDEQAELNKGLRSHDVIYLGS